VAPPAVRHQLHDAPDLRARLQKRVWRLVYGFSSRRGAHPASAFMNYGYAPLDGTLRTGAPEQHGEALYDRVAGGVPLEGRDVLEVGCGRGGGTAYIFEHHRPRALTGLDLAAGAIERSRRAHARPGLAFVQGDAEALPFRDASFDAVLNVESAHCYPDAPRFLREAHRVLRPGGFLLLADVRHTSLEGAGDDRLLPQSDMPQFVAELEASPFEIVQEEDITANVRRALELDSPRRREHIERGVPRLLRAQALAFAGVVGTPLYEAFDSGAMSYRRFVLRKAA
jgi:ubiquinone/menaquinone biosynthesis C-methylase UbiE